MQIYLSNPGIITSSGNNADEVFASVIDKKSAIREIQFYEDKKFMLGRINHDVEHFFPKVDKEFVSRTNQILFLALMQIENEIYKSIEKYGKERIGVVIGTTVTGVENNYNVFKSYAQTGKFNNYSHSKNSQANPANFVRDFLGLKNIAMGVSSACTSGNKAIIEAARLIEHNMCDAVICGGSDALDTLTVLGFQSLAVLSDVRMNPFSANRSGTNLGEGAAVFLLSREEISNIKLYSFACNSDAFHITQPNPDANMQILAISDALRKANLVNIDYINLHGTGTIANDSMEAKAVSTVLPSTFASSSKTIFGHTLGAAGAIELGICFKAISNGIIPPQLYDGIDISPKINICSNAIKYDVKTAMNINFAFGGDNAISVIGKL